MRNSFTFYRSFMEGVEQIEPEVFKRLVLAMAHYALDDEDPALEGLELSLFMAWKANIDASNRRKENGLKGGRKKTEAAETETEPEPNVTENNRTEPNVTETDSLYKDKREIEREIEKKKRNRKEKKIPPAVEDVREYCSERRNGIDAQQFCDFYESKGWKVGGQPMKDWKACVRTWEKRRSNSGFATASRHDYDFDELERELTDNAINHSA